MLANGVFDPLHYGHVLHLREARKLGTRLVVSVTRNAKVNKGPGRPAFDEKERADMLRELRCVNQVVLVDGLLEALYLFRPQVLVKGKDYEGRLERSHGEFCEKHGVQIVFTDTKKYSSTALLKGELFDRSGSG